MKLATPIPTLVEFVDDDLMECDILSRRTEIALPPAERRGTYQAVCKPGETGGIRHAIAPLPTWLLVSGVALAALLVLVCILALSVAIAWGLDWAFWHLGQWSAS